MARKKSKFSPPGQDWRGKSQVFPRTGWNGGEKIWSPVPGISRHSPPPLAIPRKMSPRKKKRRGLVLQLCSLEILTRMGIHWRVKVTHNLLITQSQNIENHDIHRIQQQNNENHEKKIIPIQNHENHEIHKFLCQIQENHWNLIIPRQNHESHEVHIILEKIGKIMKI